MHLSRHASFLARAVAILIAPILPLMSPILSAQPTPPPARLTLNINRDWRFVLQDQPGAETPAYDDSAWSAVHLPHSFSLPYFGAKSFHTGHGWYRKVLEMPRDWAGQHVFLEFEGVFQVGEIFVNGQSAGTHRGGYTGFSLDISRLLKAGENQLAVRVNNLWDARLAPRAGEHVFSGGIYRDVWLVVKSPLHLTWCGTSVTSPRISEDSGTVHVKTEVANLAPSAAQAVLRTQVLDAEGKVVSRQETKLDLPPGANQVADQTLPPVSQPQLWSPEHPYLYQVQSSLLRDGLVVDETLSPLGFRWFEWTPGRGFFLNGQPYYLYGANVHQDQAGWGDAVTNAALERDVQMVKDAGFNFIRGSHYPHDPAFSSACDRLGLLYWSEVPFWGIGGFGQDGYWNSSAYPPDPADRPAFEASVRTQLEEMVRIHRNHPSIITRKLGNETFFTEKTAFEPMRNFLVDLVAHARTLDPTRPISIGGVQRPTDDQRLDRIGDIAGYNGDGASLPAFQDPGVPNLVAEYGSVTAVRPGRYSPGWDHLAKVEGKPVYPWRAGQAIWCMFDHGSIAGENLGRMGIVDYFRIPKRAWYWYRNEYRQIPPPEWPTEGVPARLSLRADKTTIQRADGTDDVQILVTILDASGKPLSNSPPVTLELVSGPGEYPTGPRIVFEPDSDIAIRDGQAAITFRSFYAGRSILRATSPGLEPAELSLQCEGGPAWREGETPAAPDRPYLRHSAAPQDRTKGVNLASSRPTKASSLAPAASSASLTDGNSQTSWAPATDDVSPWIQVDLENTYTLRRAVVRLSEPLPAKLAIQVSANGTDWAEVGHTSDHEPRSDFEFAGDFGSGLRFLRIQIRETTTDRVVKIADLLVEGGTD